MTTRTVVNTYCTPCQLDNDKDIKATRYREYDSDGKPLFLDLCPQHKRELKDPRDAMLVRYGLRDHVNGHKPRKKTAKRTAKKPAAKKAAVAPTSTTTADPPVAAVAAKAESKPALSTMAIKALARTNGNTPEAALPYNGKRKGKRSDRPLDKPCMWCPWTGAWDTSVQKHQHTAHNAPISVRELYGTVCPICNKDCGKKPLTVHVTEHGDFTHINQAFALAFEKGDPYDIVAKVLAKGKELQPA